MLFLVPLERVYEPDVITVYRGSYCHAAYVTDVRERLSQIDCDYFVFAHDDVMLNPRIDEASFRETFPLGPDDGFIPHVFTPPEYVGAWAWYFRFVSSLMFPKSILFGSGVEPANVVKYLPDPRMLRDKFERHGLVYQDKARFSQEGFHDVAAGPTQFVLHGYARPYFETNEMRSHCDQTARRLVDLMAESLRHENAARAVEGSTEAAVDLPIPLVMSGFYTDFYILPKSGLDAYAHWIGVASAANLFVEVIAPTILHACCEKVWTAEELGLQFAFAHAGTSIFDFADPKFAALHPYKLSALKKPELQDAFFEVMQEFRAGRSATPVARAGASRINPFLDDLQSMGWGAPEDWGRWSLNGAASITFLYDPEHPVKGLHLRLTAPDIGTDVLTGRVRVNGVREYRLAIAPKEPALEVWVPAADFTTQSVNTIEVLTDTPIKAPGDDWRVLGFGMTECVFA